MGANAPPIFFLPQIRFFGYWVQEGQITKTGLTVAEMGVRILRAGSDQSSLCI